jgi:hypothetical protein
VKAFWIFFYWHSFCACRKWNGTNPASTAMCGYKIEIPTHCVRLLGESPKTPIEKNFSAFAKKADAEIFI